MKYLVVGALVVIVILAVLMGKGGEKEEEQRTLDEEVFLGPEIEASFEHVAPGEYSEVYISVASKPNHDVVVGLVNASDTYSNEKTVTTDENGVANFTFKVFEYGNYTHNVTIEAEDASHVGVVVVE